MPPKRFIYRNGNLIPKKEEKGIQSNIKLYKGDQFYEVINLSKNKIEKSEKILMPNINLSEFKKNPTFQTQLGLDNISRNKNINQESQTYISLNDNKIINDSNYENSKDFEIRKSSSFSKKNNKNIYLKKLDKLKLYSQIEEICTHLYLSPTNENKESIFEKMYNKEFEYVKKLKKNYLLKNALITRKNSYRNLSNLIKHNNSYNNKSNPKVTHNRNKVHKLKDDEIIKNYHSQKQYKTINIKKGDKYNFENYGIDSYTYRHPQIYKLNIQKKIQLPFIEKKKKRKESIELTNFIPIKKGINREEQRNEYAYYNVLKNKRLKKFHI